MNQFPNQTKVLDQSGFFTNPLFVWFRDLGLLLSKATQIQQLKPDQNITFTYIQFGKIIFFSLNGSSGSYNFQLPRASFVDSRIGSTLISGSSISGESDCSGLYFCN